MPPASTPGPPPTDPEGRPDPRPAAGVAPGFAHRLVHRLALIQPGEGPLVALAAVYCAMLFGAYYAIKPLRDALVVGKGLEHLPWFIIATMGAMLAVHPLYARLVSRVPPHRAVPWTYHVLATNLVGFFLVLAFMPEWSRWVAPVLFVWTSVFNLLAVSVFWSFMSEVFSSGQGARLFGLVSVGGTIGSIAGAAFAGAAVEFLPPMALLLVAAVMLQVGVLCVRPLWRRARAVPRANGGDAPGVMPVAGPAGALDVAPGDDASPIRGSLRRILASPHLTRVALYVACFTLTSTVLYFEQARIVSGITGPNADALRTQAFARIDLLANIATVFLQVFASGRVVTRLGVGRTLAITPVATALGLCAILVQPSLATLTIVQIVRRSLHFALDRPARELLFIDLPRVDRFATKSFIDTFVYRAGDMLAASVYGVSSSGAWAVGLPMAGLLISVAWAGLGLRLGQREKASAGNQRMLGVTQR